MSGFFKITVLLAGVLGLWACYLPFAQSGYICEDEDFCPGGSFCFRAGEDKEGLCVWGEWAEDELGVWTVLPKLSHRSSPEMQADSQNPRLFRVQSSPTLPFSLEVGSLGASAVPPFLASEGVVVRCDGAMYGTQFPYVLRKCFFHVEKDGEYTIRASVENDNGRRTIFVHWTVSTP